MSVDLDRITHPLRLAHGSHEPGSGKGCAMNVISYINGDANITDFPPCSARALARLVQRYNDSLPCDENGYLSPSDSLRALDLAWRTVGTADVADSVVWRWLSDVIRLSPFGSHHYRRPDCQNELLEHIATLCERQSVPGSAPSRAEWQSAWELVGETVNRMRLDSWDCFSGNVYLIADNAREDVTRPQFFADVVAAGCAATPISCHKLRDFCWWAVDRWRELAGLGDPQVIDPRDVDVALEKIGV